MQVCYHENGSIRAILFRKDGKPHRIGGPAIVEWDENGNLVLELWYRYGKEHRENGPAFLEYHHGVPVMKSWWYNGVRHRTDGPAFIGSEDGIIEEKWFVDGKKLTEKEIENLRRPNAHCEALLALPMPIYEAIWEEYLAFFNRKALIFYEPYLDRCLCSSQIWICLHRNNHCVFYPTPRTYQIKIRRYT